MKKSVKTNAPERHYDILWGMILVLLTLGMVSNLVKPINPDGSIDEGDGKVVIENRLGADLVVVVDKVPEAIGVAVVAHGLGGNKDGTDIVAIAETMRDHGLTTVRYDASNAKGESGGYLSDAKATTYVNDLVDVLDWAKQQAWFKPPLILAGHSLGATASALYAERHPDEVSGLILISGVVSGTINLQAAPQRSSEGWERMWQEIKSSFDGQQSSDQVNWLPFFIDLLQFNILNDADKLTMPVLIVAGENDELAPVIHQQKFYDALPGSKELQIIANAGHVFRQDPELSTLKQVINQWLDVLLP
ncbi:MAG: alpha/beta fold hydrolase [Patescibacteria group bacterium]|jgi:pimeloyl-ACP methyl ester carboxylesterase